MPTENATPLGAIDAADAGQWCGLGRLLVPYGGFLAGRLQAGETVLVNGATGAFGSAGVRSRWRWAPACRRDGSQRGRP